MSSVGIVGAGRPRIAALDGLRGLAVAAVLLFHDGRLVGGFLGVDLFFALSGFLITGLLIDERSDTGGVDLVAFWKRRAKRLLPAVMLFLVAIVPLMYAFGTTAQTEAARDGVWPALFYVANWSQIAQSTDYWALFTDPSPLTHLWSLAVEEQFYVLWPLIALLCLRRDGWRIRFGFVTAAGAVASVILMATLYDPDSTTRVYMGTDTRAFSLLIGALAAIIALGGLADRVATRVPIVVEVTHVVALGLIVSMWITVDGSSNAMLYRGGLVVHASACALLAATIGCRHTTLVARVMAIAPLRWLGLISYGLYLWHWPVFMLLDEGSTGLSPIPLTLVRWVVSLAAAFASYHLVEMPIRTAGKLNALRPAAFAGVGVIAVLIGTTTLIPQRSAAVARPDPTAITLPGDDLRPATTVVPGPDGGEADPDQAANPDDDVAASTTIPPGLELDSAPSTVVTTIIPRPASREIRTVAWQGDSVAYDSAPGVLAAMEASGLHASAQNVLGVGLVPRANADPFSLFVEPLLADPPDAVVVMLSGWDSEFAAADQRAAFDRYASAWIDVGTLVIVITPPPVDPARHTSDVSVMLDAATAVAAEHPDEVVVLDGTALWGPFRTDLDGDGIPERKPDGVHVCPSGAALLGHWLMSEMSTIAEGFNPAPPSTWADGDWVDDPRYDDPPGGCARR